jgi:hypothetical protein
MTKSGPTLSTAHKKQKKTTKPWVNWALGLVCNFVRMSINTVFV